MHGESFGKLHRILLKSDMLQKRKRGKTINDDILHSQCLSMTLRRFVGGDNMDISSNHGVAIDETKLCREVSQVRSEGLKSH